MFTKEMIDKIDNYLHQKFSIIFDFEFNGLLLLWGGAIKSIIMDTPINDLDFVLLLNSGEKENICEFIKKNKLNYNCLKGLYKFEYNGVSIDMSYRNDLHNYGIGTDLIFYDIHRKQIIPIGIKVAIKERKIKIYGGYYSSKVRKQKKSRLITARKFIMFMSGDNTKVRTAGKVKYYWRLFVKFLKFPGIIKKRFRRYLCLIKNFLKK